MVPSLPLSTVAAVQRPLNCGKHANFGGSARYRSCGRPCGFRAPATLTAEWRRCLGPELSHLALLTCGRGSTEALHVTGVAEMEANRNVFNTAFLMIVSPRDCPIALYTIPRLARLAESSACFQATVYCNGLSV